MAAPMMFYAQALTTKKNLWKAWKANPQTYADCRCPVNGELETSAREDALFSPFSEKSHFDQRSSGNDTAPLTLIAGTCGRQCMTPEKKMTYMNLVHLDGVDGTRPSLPDDASEKEDEASP